MRVCVMCIECLVQYQAHSECSRSGGCLTSESKRERHSNMLLNICDWGPASSPFIPHFSAQVLTWTPGDRVEVRALRLSSILPFPLLPLFSHLGLSVQVGPIMPNLTLFILCALRGVPAPLWHKPRTRFMCWAPSASPLTVR